MSDAREMSTTRHKPDASSQSSDEFLQQFPAPPVPQHFSDVNAIDNNESHQLNERAYYPDSNAPTLNSYPMPTNAFVQKPNDDHHNPTTNHPSNAMSAPAAQREPSIPNAHALNTNFTFVDRPEKKVHWTKRNCFFRWICCSLCFPPWVAYILWFIVVAVIICIIVIGAILGSFKMPTIDFAGLNSTLPSGTQQIEFSSTGVVIHAGLILNVINPNILDMKLSDMTAKAYYPINGTMVQIGKGYLDHQFIPKKSDTNFTYPFQIDYNPSDPNSRYLLSSISDKCGFTGNPPSDIDISYDVSLNAQVLFVHVSPTISSSASFACPFQKGQIPGLSSNGSSGQGGLDGILGGLGAQVNETSATTTPATARATTALPSSLLTTAHSSAVRSTLSFSIIPTALPSTPQSTSNVASTVVHPSLASPSVAVVPHTTTTTSSALVLTSTSIAPITSSTLLATTPAVVPHTTTTTSSVPVLPSAVPVPLTTTTTSSALVLTSTSTAPITSSTLLATTSVVVPSPSTSVPPQVVMSSSTTAQPTTSRATPVIHTSSNPATLVRPTSIIKSSTTRPTPTPIDNEDDADDDGDDEDGEDGEDDDGDDGDDDGDDEDDDGDDDGDDEQ